MFYEMEVGEGEGKMSDEVSCIIESGLVGLVSSPGNALVAGHELWGMLKSDLRGEWNELKLPAATDKEGRAGRERETLDLLYRTVVALLRGTMSVRGALLTMTEKQREEWVGHVLGVGFGGDMELVLEEAEPVAALSEHIRHWMPESGSEPEPERRVRRGFCTPIEDQPMG